MANVLATLCLIYSQSRADYVSSLKRDVAHRSYIYCQLDGIPCDTNSACPPHTSFEAPYTWDDNPEQHNAQIVCILRTWKQITKTSSKKIMPGELLGGHNLFFVKYYDTWHGHTMENTIYLSNWVLNCTDVRFAGNANQNDNLSLTATMRTKVRAMSTQILPYVGTRRPDIQ